MHAARVSLTVLVSCFVIITQITHQQHLQVVALRSSQLKAEAAYTQAEAAEAKLAEAGQQLQSLSAQLSTGSFVYVCMCVCVCVCVSWLVYVL